MLESGIPMDKFPLLTINSNNFYGYVDRKNSKGQRLVNIAINSENKYTVAKTVCHEFRHVEQFYYGWLKQKGNYSIWLDEEIDTCISYREEPWEIDAFYFEDIYFENLPKEILLDICSP
jgi:hypothetical protein